MTPQDGTVARIRITRNLRSYLRLVLPIGSVHDATYRTDGAAGPHWVVAYPDGSGTIAVFPKQAEIAVMITELTALRLSTAELAAHLLALAENNSRLTVDEQGVVQREAARRLRFLGRLEEDGE